MEYDPSAEPPPPEDRMPFGKHKGKRLRDLPRDYLRWMRDESEAAQRDPYLYEYAKAHADDPDRPASLGREVSDSTPMPWGKHKGVPLGQVPAEYLRWMADQDFAGKFQDLQAYARAHANDDGGRDSPESPPKPSAPTTPTPNTEYVPRAEYEQFRRFTVAELKDLSARVEAWERNA